MAVRGELIFGGNFKDSGGRLYVGGGLVFGRGLIFGGGFNYLHIPTATCETGKCGLPVMEDEHELGINAGEQGIQGGPKKR